jgi:hypothetical protein
MVSIVTLSDKPRRKANPTDFWTSLAETASDPNLAYLQGQGQTSDAEEAWWPLTLAMLALFASMGGNLYMGWIAVDVYRRYLNVAADEHEDDDFESSRRDDDDVDEDWDRGPRRRRDTLAGSRRAVA